MAAIRTFTNELSSGVEVTGAPLDVKDPHVVFSISNNQKLGPTGMLGLLVKISKGTTQIEQHTFQICDLYGVHLSKEELKTLRDELSRFIDTLP